MVDGVVLLPHMKFSLTPQHKPALHNDAQHRLVSSTSSSKPPPYQPITSASNVASESQGQQNHSALRALMEATELLLFCPLDTEALYKFSFHAWEKVDDSTFYQMLLSYSNITKMWGGGRWTLVPGCFSTDGWKPQRGCNEYNNGLILLGNQGQFHVLLWESLLLPPAGTVWWVWAAFLTWL